MISNKTQIESCTETPTTISLAPAAEPRQLTRPSLSTCRPVLRGVQSPFTPWPPVDFRVAFGKSG